LIIERDGTLARVQIKTGRLRTGAVLFSVCSTYGHHPHPKILKRTYEGEVDFFAVHCRDNGGVYLIAIDDLPVKRLATLRITQPKNNQAQRVRWARDYEIGTVAIGGLRVPSGA
jgi:PD-(D/E)XK endonuclease